ncbi:MAG: putative manganese-dependent inorganic diphosphatase [Verrucomicrobiota bacterium]|nr:putative manganese-dependent inorganic diphosphatase [Verrucomicrobiota bacterium]
MSEILVIGHRNPDTDSICAAIAYADFKQKTGVANAVAARCGDINDRIDFVLRKFRMAPPRFVADVRPKVRDVMEHRVIQVALETSACEAFEIMDRYNIRTLPILDDERTCHGLVSVFKMSKFFLPSHARLQDTRRVLTSLNHLQKTLGAQGYELQAPDKEEELILMIGSMRMDSFEKRLEEYDPRELLLVCGDREDIQLYAVEKKIRIMIITGGLKVSDGIRALAKANGVSILVSEHDSATTAMLCRSAVSVKHIRTEHFLHFNEDEPLNAIRNVAISSQFQAFPVVDAFKRVVGMLSKTDFTKRVKRKLILVDHNEISQAVKGADQVDILEIIDHHRIGALTTQQPILFVNRPVGSTSTIIAEMYLHANLEIPKPIAGLLLSGIISDTLNLSSPTSTETDSNMLQRLEAITHINATEFTDALFSSGSVLTHRTPETAIINDCKEYRERGRAFSVAQIEEIGFEQFWEQRDLLYEALEQHRGERQYFFAALFITDVVRQSSLLLVSGSSQLKSAIQYNQIEPDVYELPGIVSRKKQLLPYLIKCLENALGKETDGQMDT